jgi:hypothetical protein
MRLKLRSPDDPQPSAWPSRRGEFQVSLPEVYASIPVPATAGFWR